MTKKGTFLGRREANLLVLIYFKSKVIIYLNMQGHAEPVGGLGQIENGGPLTMYR